MLTDTLKNILFLSSFPISVYTSVYDIIVILGFKILSAGARQESCCISFFFIYIIYHWYGSKKKTFISFMMSYARKLTRRFGIL